MADKIKIIENVLLKSAVQLVEENRTSDAEEVRFPVDLNKLVGKTFAFKIEITTYDLTNFDEVYVVTNLADDESIIYELKEKKKISEGKNKEFIEKKTPIPSVENNVANTSCDMNQISKCKLVDVNNSSTPCNVNDSKKASKKGT
ncbi:hypothetical protein Hanom_Chr16g01454311 [Helianthus anomalus]